ncbi:MAG: hypothetical protein WAT84_01925 [Candidatus Moraniibacteriota bacterium]
MAESTEAASYGVTLSLCGIRQGFDLIRKEFEITSIDVKSNHWQDIRQLINIIMETGFWRCLSDGPVHRVEHIRVFITLPPERFGQYVQEAPYTEFRENPSHWEPGWYICFPQARRFVNLFEFFRRESVEDTALQHIAELIKTASGPIIAPTITRELTTLFSVKGKDGSNTAMSQVVNQWCRRGHLERRGPKGSRTYRMSEEWLRSHDPE